MATYFPQLSSGMMVQRGYAPSLAFKTDVIDLRCGKRYSRAQWPNPLFRADLVYPSISDATKAALEAFHADREENLQEFVFLDPDGNLLSYSEDFAQAYWFKNLVTHGGAVADPFAGTAATLLTGSAGGAYVAADFCPDGDVDGFVFCLSAWVKLPAGGSVSLVFIDGGYWDQVFTLPAGQWKRLTFTRTITDTAVPAIAIEVGAQAAHVFGAQAVPMVGPGIYAKTPGGEGLRAKCRFASDLEFRSISPNQWSARTSVRELP